MISSSGVLHLDAGSHGIIEPISRSSHASIRSCPPSQVLCCSCVLTTSAQTIHHSPSCEHEFKPSGSLQTEINLMSVCNPVCGFFVSPIWFKKYNGANSNFNERLPLSSESLSCYNCIFVKTCASFNTVILIHQLQESSIFHLHQV